MLAHQPVLFTNVIALVSGFAMLGSFVLIPNFVQAPGDLPADLARLVDYGFGVSATTTGLYLLPGALMGLVGGPLAGRLGARFGWKVPLVVGMATAGLGIAAFALWHDHPWQIVLGNVALGFGIVLAFAAMATIIVTSVRPTETGVATGMNTVMRTIGGVIGGQMGAAILTAKTIPGTPVPAESAFVTAFWLSAIAALGAAVLAAFVTPRRARQPRRVAVEVTD
jgi:MFS family permease